MEVEPYENRPIPAPPVAVARARTRRFTLANRSPLSVAFRHIPGGWRRYVEYVDLAARNGDQGMAKFIACYQGLSARDRASVWPEQICELAGVSPGELVGAACRAIWENKAAESSMVSSMAHPQVLMNTIRLAKKAENYKDRELYFRLSGSLPDKKGASINIFNQAAGAEPVLPDLGQGRKLRSFDDEIIDMPNLEASAPFLVKDGDGVSPDNH